MNKYVSITISFAIILACGHKGNPAKDSKAKSEVFLDTIQLFNGTDLNGWSYDSLLWYIEDGMLIGSTMEKQIEKAEWIVTAKTYGNFELSLYVKLIGGENKNSGIYYRGQWDDDVVTGYEFDVGGWGDDDPSTPYNPEIDANWWGELHDPYRRSLDEFAVGLPKEEVNEIYNEAEWNHVKIRVVGNHIQHWLNKVQVVDWYEEDKSIQKEGFIGFQLHDESQNKVFYKNIILKRISIDQDKNN